MGKCLHFRCIISFHSRTTEDKLKLGTITPTQFVNKSVKKKVKNLNFSADVSKRFARVFPNFDPFWNVSSKFCKCFVIKPWKMFFLFTTDKQHVCRQQEMVLTVLPGIAVKFTDQKICRLKSWKSEKTPKCSRYHFVPLKGCKTASHVPISEN